MKLFTETNLYCKNNKQTNKQTYRENPLNIDEAGERVKEAELKYTLLRFQITKVFCIIFVGYTIRKFQT
jgi:hypothetical protein